MNLSGSAMAMDCVPRAAMALRFFEPSMAPTPEPPAAFDLSEMTQADLTRFSPAGPIPMTRTSSSRCSSLMARSVSHVVFPQTL